MENEVTFILFEYFCCFFFSIHRWKRQMDHFEHLWCFNNSNECIHGFFSRFLLCFDRIIGQVGLLAARTNGSSVIFLAQRWYSASWPGVSCNPWLFRNSSTNRPQNNFHRNFTEMNSFFYPFVIPFWTLHLTGDLCALELMIFQALCFVIHSSCSRISFIFRRHDWWAFSSSIVCFRLLFSRKRWKKPSILSLTTTKERKKNNQKKEKKNSSWFERSNFRQRTKSFQKKRKEIVLKLFVDLKAQMRQQLA